MSEIADLAVHAAAVSMIDARQIMAIATLRSDGWPQNTFVGYANEGLNIYFLILRASQKFRNIAHDERVALAIGEQPPNIHFAEAVYASARAVEVTETPEREEAWQLLMKRHPNLEGRGMPDEAVTAIMRARCEHVSVVDYSIGLGHTDSINVSQG